MVSISRPQRRKSGRAPSRQAFIRPQRIQTLEQPRGRTNREVDRPGFGAHEETPRQESREGVELGCDPRLRLLDAAARQDGIRPARDQSPDRRLARRPNAIYIAELPTEKQAQTLLMPVSL